MNWKRFSRVMAGQAVGMAAAFGAEALAQAPLPEMIKLSLGAALGAMANAAAKESRERAKWAGKESRPLSWLF